ncbi:GNAT family N-acetyltransferase [Vibrio sp. LaRot3]|uniref:GNAT family N-acetyltransferase n=1 Tax=Vibrio sp. LaRot3 TaxID=2998829 RepID=UPI0022CE2C26|nr:N-acetyltransferase [Vibrio sp. LaRot3]MDA0149599.1 N-acetyltransferase [Vibrio sp. LaRot3]
MKFSRYLATQTSQIEQLFLDTFADSEGAEEGQVIAMLVKDLFVKTASHDLECFVAISEDEQIMGAIVFTPLDNEVDSNERERMCLLSPVAVSTSVQGQGIGQALINYGLNQMSKAGNFIAVTYGDPSFYSKVGFKQIAESIIPAPFPLSYPNGWLAVSLTGSNITPVSGTTRCVEALNDAKYW